MTRGAYLDHKVVVCRSAHCRVCSSVGVLQSKIIDVDLRVTSRVKDRHDLCVLPAVLRLLQERNKAEDAENKATKS